MKIIYLFLILIACCPCSPEYREFYAHVHSFCIPSTQAKESEYYLILLVDARHLDYTDNCSFFRTVGKHPTDGSKNGDVGHAWIYLHGNGIDFEGGHSGERGALQAKYFDGIMNYNDWGYANPTDEQKKNPRYEENPVKYFWTTQLDGFFQKGPGKHRPTFAAKIDLTEEQFVKIISFIRKYPYVDYSLTRCQCTTFAVQVASLAGLQLDANVTMSIEKEIWFRGRRIRFWDDPAFAKITFACPDMLEASLMEAVLEGRAEYAMDLYEKQLH